MEKKFVYDAFISYRHTELDKFVAENLHKQLESFRLPKNIAKSRKGEKTKIERVFRDKEELPLTSDLNDPIMTALHNSEWLIVICSPRLRESLWCKKEIETFVKLRGRERVLAVLIEGEPSESFPDELLFRIETRVLPDGTKEEVKIPVEPLAADVRGKSKKEVIKAMKTEILRLYAAMFSLNYDDLRQRHKEQKMKRILTASLIGGAACLAFGVYSTATALRISGQNKQIEAQSAEILAQSEQIQQQNAELALKQALSLAELSEYYLEKGDRHSAINSAKEALGESGGIQLPYTAEAQYALTESIRAYDIGYVNKAEYQIKTTASIDNVVQSPDLSVLAIFDSSDMLTIYNTDNREVITYLDAGQYNFNKSNAFVFLCDSKFAYLTPDGTVCIYDMMQKKVVKEISDLDPYGIYADDAGCYLVLETQPYIYTAFDSDSYEELGSTPQIKTGAYVDGPYVLSDGYLACSFSDPDVEEREKMTLYMFDINGMDVRSTCDLGSKRIKSLKCAEETVYVASTLFADSFMSGDALATAIDIQSGSVLWENKLEDFFARIISLPANSEHTDLLFITDKSVSLINCKTGETSFFAPLESEALSVYRYVENNAFSVFCKNGNSLLINKELNRMDNMNYRFDCKTISNSHILSTSGGIVVVESESNLATVYTTQKSEDIVETEQEIALPQDIELISYNDAIEIAKEYGLESAEMVRELYYSDDKQYCFLVYKDSTLVIYDVENKEIINKIVDAYSTRVFWGTDDNGYTYLAGYSGMYILNSDMEAVAWIDHARMVDLEKKKIYLEWYGAGYEAPIYSLEELLVIAEQYAE